MKTGQSAIRKELSGISLKQVPCRQKEDSIPLTLIYQMPGTEKQAEQSFNVWYYQLGLVGNPAPFLAKSKEHDADDCIQQEPLVLIDLLKGNRYRITIEVENDVTNRDQ